MSTVHGDSQLLGRHETIVGGRSTLEAIVELLHCLLMLLQKVEVRLLQLAVIDILAK